MGLAQWRIEASDEIPTRENGRPRSVEAIMREVNRAFEVAVQRDPANWFWVHNRWKLPETEVANRELNTGSAEATAETEPGD